MRYCPRFDYFACRLCWRMHNKANKSNECILVPGMFVSDQHDAFDNLFRCDSQYVLYVLYAWFKGCRSHADNTQYTTYYCQHTYLINKQYFCAKKEMRDVIIIFLVVINYLSGRLVCVQLFWVNSLSGRFVVVQLFLIV